MVAIFLIGVLFLVVAGAIWVIREIRSDAVVEDNRWPLFAKPLLSEREQVLYQRLVGLYPDHIVVAQVALSQLLAVKPGTPNWQVIRNRYQQLVADFVLCRRDFTVVAVIELDDPSHAAPERQEADQRKTRAVESAGLRLVRIPAGPIPSESELQQMLQVGSTSAVPIVATPGMAPPAISAGTAAVLIPVLSLVLIGLVVAGVWMAISHVVSIVPKVMSTPPITAAPAPAPRPLSPAPAPVNAKAIQEAEQKRLEAGRALAAQQAADALAKRKQAAWAEYYKPPASCEHPPAWADQVECGNRYIRAKREFEKLWSNQVNSQPAPINPDSSIVIGRPQVISSPTGSASASK